MQMVSSAPRAAGACPRAAAGSSPARHTGAVLVSAELPALPAGHAQPFPCPGQLICGCMKPANATQPTAVANGGQI